MKRLGILIGILIILAIAVPALAASWTGTILISNNTSTAYPMLGVTTSANVTYMVAQSFINSTGNDTVVQSAGVNQPFTLAQDRINFAIPVDANTNNQVQFLTGQTEQQYPFSIVPGQGGYVTTNDTAALEHGATFTDNLSTYVDISYAHNILMKPSAYYLGTDGSGNITGAIVGAGTPSAYPSISSNTSGGGSGLSFSVNLSSGVSVNDLLLILTNVNNSAGVPTTSISNGYINLNTATYTVGQSRIDIWYKFATSTETNPTITMSVSSNYTYQMMRFASGTYTGVPAITNPAFGSPSVNANPPNLTSNFTAVKTLWIAVAGINSGTPASAAPAGYSNFNTTTSGDITTNTATLQATAASENPGTFTSINNYWAANTIGIEGYFVTNSVSGITTGSKVISSISDGVNYWLVVDGTPSAANATTGTMINNDFNWLLNNTPYTNYLKMEVSGVEKLWYQPTTIIQGTTLPDRDGTKNGDITWGTNPSGVTSTLSSFEPTNVTSTVSNIPDGVQDIAPLRTDNSTNVNPHTATPPVTPITPLMQFLAGQYAYNIPEFILWMICFWVASVIVFAITLSLFNHIGAAGILASGIFGLGIVLLHFPQWYLSLSVLGMAVSLVQENRG